RQGRIELAAAEAGRPDQLCLVHLDVLTLADGRIHTEIGGNSAIEDRRRQESYLIFPPGRLRQRPFENVLPAPPRLERQISRALPLALDLDPDLPAGRDEPGVGEANAELDGLAALVSPPVRLNLCLAIPDQARTGHESDGLHPEPAEVAVAGPESPPPGVVE